MTRVSKKAKRIVVWLSGLVAAAALVVGNISTIESGIQHTISFFQTEDSSVDVVFRGSTEHSISVLFSNTGTRPATLSHDMWLSVPEPVGQDIPLTIQGAPESSAFLIEPKRDVLLNLIFDEKSKLLDGYFTASQVSKVPKQSVCGVTMFGASFRAHGYKPVMLGFVCDEVILFILDVARKKAAS